MEYILVFLAVSFGTMISNDDEGSCGFAVIFGFMAVILMLLVAEK